MAPFFRTGFFGCRALNRSEIVAEALAWVQATVHPEARAIVVGDTPRDILCARQFGLPSIAVATGPYAAADLAAYEPTVCCTDLGEAAVSLHRLWLHAAL